MVTCVSAAIGGEGTGGTDRERKPQDPKHTDIYTLSLHDALPIFLPAGRAIFPDRLFEDEIADGYVRIGSDRGRGNGSHRSGEETAGPQAHRYLHSFPTRRSSDLPPSWSSHLSRPPLRG